MRLLYIANIRLPTEKAHGIQIMEMCAAFARNNIEIVLIVPTRRNQELENVDPFEYYGVERNFEIRYITTPDPTWLMSVPGGVYYKIQSYLYGRRLVSVLSSIIRTDDSIYTRDELMLPSLVRLSNNVIWEAHSFLRRLKMFSWGWSRIKTVVTITKGLKEILSVALMPFGVSPETILVAPDGVNLDTFKIKSLASNVRKNLGLPIDKTIIMYTGQLFDWKGATVLLDVARKFQIPNTKFQTHNDVLFIFVGGTKDDVERFKNKAQGLNSVLVLGQKPHNNISLYQKAADVLVLPNKKGSAISERWTSPLKLFEYMASGVPIVASDLPSIREVLNESNAVLVEPNNPEALAQGIYSVLHNDELAKRISTKALEDVQQFTWGKRAERILTALR